MPRVRLRTWVRIEQTLRGVSLGLAAVVALWAPTLAAAGTALGCAAGATFLAVVAAGLWKRRGRTKAAGGSSSTGGLLGPIVFTLLEHPLTIHIAMAIGYTVGCVVANLPLLPQLAFASGGAVVGLGADTVRQIGKAWLRRLLALGVLGAAAGAVAAWVMVGENPPVGSGSVVAAAVMGSAVLQYVLVFSGRADETDGDVALLFAAIALALSQLPLMPTARGIVVLAPVAGYVIYSERILRHLVVFRQVLRGLGYEQEGNLRDALLWYRTALQVDPKSDLAAAGNWRVHRKIDLARLASDDEIIGLIDANVCLERVRTLIATGELTEQQTSDAEQLLAIVEHQRPDLPRVVAVERVRMLLAAKRYDDAFAHARQIVALKPLEVLGLAPGEARAVLAAWALLLREPTLVARGGADLPGEGHLRLALIVAIERQLTESNDSETAAALKPFVYDALTLADVEAYTATAPEDTLGWLDHRLLWQSAVGVANEAGNSADGRHRAIDRLRIVDLCLPPNRLALWKTLAELHELLGDSEAARGWYERVRDLGRTQGPGRLSGPDSEAYFAVVRLLAERAEQAGDLTDAIDHWKLYSASRSTGLATLRKLRELQEAIGATVDAIRTVESAFAYSLDAKARREWSSAKLRLYARVTDTEVRERLAEVQGFFDFAYCYRHARGLFDQEASGTEVRHFLDLAALGGGPQLRKVNFLLGRTHLRAGQYEDAAACFEQVVEPKPDRFPDADTEEAYFRACRLLGDLRLDHLADPQGAIAMYSVYKDYLKSGADTLYQLGRAYEALGRPESARKWYDLVLVYPKHPRAADAQAALDRLGAPQS